GLEVRLTGLDGTKPNGGARGRASTRERGLAYAAPEITGRMSCAVDHRADLYSIGAVLYEMLTGSSPFPFHDPLELVHPPPARIPTSPAEVIGAIPVPLFDIVMRLLEKMPERRYQSAEAVVADLREAERRLRTTGAIAPFELGVFDLARELPLPERLYGRDR